MDMDGNRYDTDPRVDDAVTERRWAEFIARMRNGSTPTLLRTVADLMEDRRDPYYALANVHIDAFAEEFGWPDTITAIARAQRLNNDAHAQERAAEHRKRGAA